MRVAVATAPPDEQVGKAIGKAINNAVDRRRAGTRLPEKRVLPDILAGSASAAPEDVQKTLPGPAATRNDTL